MSHHRQPTAVPAILVRVIAALVIAGGAVVLTDPGWDATPDHQSSAAGVSPADPGWDVTAQSGTSAAL